MKLISARPPNFEKIAAVFPGAYKSTTIFAYGDTIYAPGAISLPPELLAHEAVHGARQLEMGVEAWWDRYLADPSFRYHEELLAHQAEYRKICEMYPSRQVRRSALKVVAKRLSGSLYGGMVSLRTAMEDIAA